MMLPRLQKRLVELEASGLHRELREVQGPQGRLLSHAGRDLVNFSSNNYLGLAEAPALRKAMIRGVEKWGVGSGASRLVNGSLQPFHELERALAEFKGTEAALVFNSGYHANLGVLGCIVGEGDVLFSDELNHASMIDGMRLSRAQRVVYRHNDLQDLREKLKEQRRQPNSAGQFLIATETVFSMDGDLCPLAELLKLSEEFDAWLYLDEAHATGVFGATGAGCFEEFRNSAFSQGRVIQMGTLGKALGCFGAYVAGPRVLIDFLVNRSRPFIYTTALPPAMAEAAREALRIVAQEPERRETLWERVKQWNREWGKAPSPIIPILVGDSKKAVEWSQKLFEAGFWVTAIRPPTVPEGTARLRITLMATHREEDVFRLVKFLKKI